MLLACAFTPTSGCTELDSHQPPARLEIPLARSVLDNGLEVVVVENHALPLVTAVLAVRAGACTEDASVNGYSHLFEHMIFTGSDAVPDAMAFRSQLDQTGALANAVTSIDTVRYFFTVQRESLDTAMGLFAGAIQHPALLPTELDQERKVVLAEFDLNESDPTFGSYTNLIASLFGTYATRLLPLGSRDVVTSVSSEQLRAAHTTYYVPNNALLVLSGDIEPEAGVALAKQHFAGWLRAEDPLVAHPVPKPSELAADQVAVRSADVSRSTLSIAWQGPAAEEDPEGVLAAELLATVTGQSDHTFRDLLSEGQASSAAFSFYPARGAGQFVATLQIPFGHEFEVIQNLSGALGNLGLPGNVSTKQLDAAKDELWSESALSSDDPTVLAQDIGFTWGLSSVDRYENYLPDLYEIGPAAIERLARRYLHDRPKAMVLLSSEQQLRTAGLSESTLRGAF